MCNNERLRVMDKALADRKKNHVKKEEAQTNLKKIGVLNKNGNIAKAYKPYFIVVE